MVATSAIGLSISTDLGSNAISKVVRCWGMTAWASIWWKMWMDEVIHGLKWQGLQEVKAYPIQSRRFQPELLDGEPRLAKSDMHHLARRHQIVATTC